MNPTMFPLLLLALSAGPAAMAQERVQAPAPQDEAPVQLDAVVVTGVHPAPGLWEISRDGKRLLVMGTLSPAPKRMVWSSPEVEARIAEADVVLASPGVSVGTDVGLFRGAMLWPAYRRSKRNPDGKVLEDVLAPPVFERWAGLRERYLAGDDDVDELRPLHAAKTLFDAAVRDAGMTDDSLVDPVVKRVAKAHDIPVVSTTVRLTIADPKAMLAELEATQLDDEECLVQTMDRLETDLSTMVVRANAWAEGDIGRLRALPFVDQKRACRRALVSNEIARQQGITDLDARVQRQWLEAVHAALSEHDTVFATLPIARLLEDGGVLAVLRRDGFEVDAPE